MPKCSTLFCQSESRATKLASAACVFSSTVMAASCLAWYFHCGDLIDECDSQILLTIAAAALLGIIASLLICLCSVGSNDTSYEQIHGDSSAQNRRGGANYQAVS